MFFNLVYHFVLVLTDQYEMPVPYNLVLTDQVVYTHH